MASPAITLEASVGINTIDSRIRFVYEQLNILLGERKLKTKYNISLMNYSTDPGVVEVLDSVATKIGEWDASIRENTKPEARRRYVFLAASVIGQLAMVLGNIAQRKRETNLGSKVDYRTAEKLFKGMAAYNAELGSDNQFKVAGDLFYKSLLSTIEIYTPSRLNASIDSDYSASNNVNKLYNRVEKLFIPRVNLVKAILSVTGLEDTVSDEQIDAAAGLMLAHGMLVLRVFGKEDVNRKWYDSAAPSAQALYNILTNYDASATTNVVSDEYGQFDEQIVDDDDESGDTGDTAGKIETTAIIKDMAHLGENTDQINYLSDSTRFTCRQYYKLFATDYLSNVDYSKNKMHQMIYKVMCLMLDMAGMQFSDRMVEQDTAADFAEYVKNLFERAARNTRTALTLHDNLLVLLNRIESNVQSKFEELYSKFRMGAPTSDSKRLVYRAINKIRDYIVFSGSYSVSDGLTVTGDRINASELMEPVYSFKEFSHNDRISMSGLTTAGNMVSKCFSLYDGVLHVEYDGLDDIDGNGVDEIPCDDIKSIYKNYVSSSLVPLIVSNGNAWVMLCGIEAFSNIDRGTLSDSTSLSPLTNKITDTLSASNIHNDTRVSTATNSAARLSDPNLLRYMATSRFIPQDDLHNTDRRMESFSRIQNYGELNTDIQKKMTDVRAVCDAYTNAISSYASSSELGYQVTRNKLYNVSPKINELVNGKELAVNKVLANYIANGDDAGTICNAICNVCTMYNVLRMSIESNPKAYTVLTNLAAYVKQLGRLHGAATKRQNTDILTEIKAILPDNYSELSHAITELYGRVEDAPRASKLSVVNEHKDEILSIANALVSSGSGSIGQFASTSDSIVSNLMTSSDDPNITSLRDALMKVIDVINSRNVTSNTIFDVQKAIAISMYGDSTTNFNYVKNLNINQLVIPVKTLNALLGIANDMKTANDNDSPDVLYELPVGGESEMDELTAMSPANAGRRALHNTMQELDDEADRSDLYEDMPSGDNYLTVALELYKKYKDANDKYQSAMDMVDTLVSYASGDIAQGNVDELLSTLISSTRVNRSVKAYASKCKHNMDLSKTLVDKYSKLLERYSENYPSFADLINALMSGKIGSEDVEYVVKELDVAKTILDDLATKNTTDTNSNERRLYAYTRSDDTAIAQIIYVLGQYLSVPHMDNKDDLLQSLENVKDVITKYSGNPLSIKVANTAISRISDSELNGPDLVATIINTVTTVGKILLSRISDEADVPMLQNVERINKPSNPSDKYGRAIDSFARSQMRGKSKSSKKIASEGKINEEEKAARQLFAKLIISDLSEDLDLSKYAYTLGKAFNTFNRVMKDERVSNLDKRQFNSVMDSFKGVQLWKNLGDNDLQREVVSAIIDDERNGDSSYPTVVSVVDAAKAGTSFNSYTQMYSDMIGSAENILNDQKTAPVAFDANGNRVSPDRAVALDTPTIVSLIVGDSAGSIDSIEELVHAVRMMIFEKLTKNYGSVDMLSNVKFADNYANRATKLMEEAMKSLYRLCDNMDTPIADIIVVTNAIGQKAGRDYIMKHVYNELSKDGDLDIDTIGMVSGEPNAYPTMMSSKTNGADIDWIDNITGLLGSIPDTMDKNNVVNGVDKYCQNEVSRQEMAMNPELNQLIKIIVSLQQLDTSTGIARGFWGNTSRDRYDAIKAIFNQLISVDGKNWAQRAEKLKERFLHRLERGSNILSVGPVKPSDAAAKQIAHLRMNPYYAVKTHDTESKEYTSMVSDLMSSGLIASSSGTTVKLSIPGLVFDRRSFKYLLMMAINLANNDQLYLDNVNAFLMAVMCYKSGVQIAPYAAMLSSIVPYMSNDSDSDKKRKVIELIDEKLHVQHYQPGENTSSDGIVKTDLGWLTNTAYIALCAYALYANKDTDANPISNFKEGFDIITNTGKHSSELGELNVKPNKPKEAPVIDTVKPETTKTSKSTIKKVGSRKPSKPRPSSVDSSPRQVETPTYTQVDDDGTEITVYGQTPTPSRVDTEDSADENQDKEFDYHSTFDSLF